MTLRTISLLALASWLGLIGAIALTVMFPAVALGLLGAAGLAAAVYFVAVAFFVELPSMPGDL